MSAPLVYSTKMTPTVIGKPNSHMMDAILASKDFDRSRTIMVGDNLETDILFGQNSGIETLLTMTGKNAMRLLCSAIRVRAFGLICCCGSCRCDE